jgi:hypothetical protein
MELFQQLVSFKYAKILKDLGVKQKSLYWWGEDIDADDKPCAIISEWYIEGITTQYSAYSVAGLGKILPENSKSRLPWKHEDRWYSDIDFSEGQKTEADARAKLLICLLKNNLTKLDGVL